MRAALELLRGRLSAFERLLAEARGVNAARGVKPQPIADSITLAWLDVWFRERRARGVQRLDTALARVPLRSLDVTDRPLQYLRAVSVYALAGRPDRARTLLAQYATDVRDSALRRDLEPT